MPEEASGSGDEVARTSAGCVRPVARGHSTSTPISRSHAARKRGIPAWPAGSAMQGLVGLGVEDLAHDDGILSPINRRIVAAAHAYAAITRRLVNALRPRVRNTHFEQ